ncbi:serine-type endopeptidase activity protein [Homalodisca vitripennis]|nr:serine-type endopeptidase activity protein [Homalodisca vitripennis]
MVNVFFYGGLIPSFGARRGAPPNSAPGSHVPLPLPGSGPGRFEPVLHEISGQVIDQEVCSINYQGYQTTDTPYIISEELICAAVAVNKSCQGDIGSPLMLKHDGNFFLLGIVATDYRCFDEYYPRLFTKLSLYMDWIVANLKF